MIPQYNTKLFANIWDNESDFIQDFNDSPFANSISSQNVQKLYYLLYAKYGNSPIANFDEMQFKIKVFSIIFQFGPSWEKRLEIQSKLRSLTEDDVISGGKMIHNHSFNPSSEPSTSTIDELDTINEQTSQITRRSKIDGYAMLWDLIVVDVTGAFIDRFSVCFKQVVAPEHILLYESED